MSTKTEKFSGISLLRAIATLGIMLYHIGYGQYYLKSFNLSAGIHVFFCISAFLIMYSTENRTAGVFLIRRLVRIIPLYALLTVATFVGAKFISALGQSDMTLGELISSLFLIPYAREGLNGGNVIRPIVGPAWTLYYEIWFAVLFAVSMKIKHKARGIISASVCVLAYGASLFIPANLAVLRLLRTGFTLDFAVGIILFYILKHFFHIFSRVPRPVWATLTVVMIPLFYLGPRNVYFLVLLSALILICSMSALQGKGLVRPVSLFSDISYSFYLIHYYVIIILGKLFDFTVLSAKSVLGVAAVFIVTFVCAAVSHVLIEKKLGDGLNKILKVK